MTMVEYSEMGDKQSQQRRRRADGAVRSVADRSAVEENRALAPQTAQTTQGRSSVDRESPCAGRNSVDFAERGSLAGSAGEIPASFDAKVCLFCMVKKESRDSAAFSASPRCKRIRGLRFQLGRDTQAAPSCKWIVYGMGKMPWVPS